MAEVLLYLWGLVMLTGGFLGALALIHAYRHRNDSPTTLEVSE